MQLEQHMCLRVQMTGGRDMSVTLQQIAEAAGVSRGTVDRALNNRGRINPEVADKIKRIAKEMGYQPNRAGRALAMSKRSIKIGVILQAMDTPFMQEVYKGVLDAKTETERMGAEVKIQKIPKTDPLKVMEAMKAMRQGGCNGIALVPAEDDRLRELIDEFAEKDGIPVVTFNSDIEESRRICFIGQDTLQSGRAAAGLMSEIIRKDGVIQVISGYPKNRGHRNRTKGFREELLKLRPDIEMPEVLYNYDDNQTAEIIMRDLISREPGISGVYLTAAGAEGVCRVLEENGLADQVKVISNDLTEGNEKYLRSGSIRFLLGQNSFAQGYEPVMTLFRKLFDGIDPEKEYRYTEIEIKTKYNI